MQDNNHPGSSEHFVEFTVNSDIYKTTLNKKFSQRKAYEPSNPKKITSFMPGTIQEVFVEPGQGITPETKLCILEAMKMKNVIVSSITGVVKEINAKPGQMVPKNFVLIELE